MIIKCSRCGSTKRVPDTWEYKTCPECLMKKRLEREREKAKKESLEFEQDDIFFGVPIVNEDCLTFRFQTLGLEARDKYFYGFHHQNCKACQHFYAKYKEKIGIWRGVNLWNTPP